MKKIIFLVFGFILVLAFTGLGQNQNNELKSSEKKHNSFYMPTPDGFCFIPPGTAVINGKNMTFQAFFMAITEVTNGQYLEFLNDLIKQGKTKEYTIAKIDTALWNDPDIPDGAICGRSYHKQKDFPVVNISREGALLYCKWLGEKYQQKNGADFKAEFRLPAEYEWEYAAMAGSDKNTFPWEGTSARNASGYLAQFNAAGQLLNPAKVSTYPANAFGLYGMAGNAAEMVSDTNIVKGGSWKSSEDKLRITAAEPYMIAPTVGFRPVMTFIGNGKN